MVGQQHVVRRTRSRAPRGRGGSSVRLFVRVSAMSACGKTKNSKWSLPSASSSRRSSVSSERRGRVDAAQRERRHARSVTSATTPSAPRPTRAARQHLGIVVRRRARQRRAVGEHQLSAATCEEMLRSRAPVPCVAGRDRAGDRSARRCRRGSRSRGRAASSASLSSWIVMPRLHAHEPAGAVDVEHAVHPVEAEQRPVGAGDVAERVPRAGDAHALPARRAARSTRAASSSARRRALDRGGRAALVAGPVAPGSRWSSPLAARRAQAIASACSGKRARSAARPPVLG